MFGPTRPRRSRSRASAWPVRCTTSTPRASRPSTRTRAPRGGPRGCRPDRRRRPRRRGPGWRRCCSCTSGPRRRARVSVSISTAVWTVMCSEPVMRAPFSGCASAYSRRSAIRPGISCSASVISLRPNSASERSATLKSAVSVAAVVVIADIEKPPVTQVSALAAEWAAERGGTEPVAALLGRREASTSASAARRAPP